MTSILIVSVIEKVGSQSLAPFIGRGSRREYAQSILRRCGNGQEQQSAKSLIITSGKCNAFWGCHCDCCMQERGGDKCQAECGFSVSAGSNIDGVL